MKKKQQQLGCNSRCTTSPTGHITCLGIQISPRLTELFNLNFTPLLIKINDDLQCWMNSQISVMGRIVMWDVKHAAHGPEPAAKWANPAHWMNLLTWFWCSCEGWELPGVRSKQWEASCKILHQRFFHPDQNTVVWKTMNTKHCAKYCQLSLVELWMIARAICHSKSWGENSVGAECVMM